MAEYQSFLPWSSTELFGCSALTTNALPLLAIRGLPAPLPGLPVPLVCLIQITAESQSSEEGQFFKTQWPIAGTWDKFSASAM